MPEQEPDLFQQLFAFLEQLLIPDWNDLFLLIPYVLILGIVAFALYLAGRWRRAGGRNTPPLARRRPLGVPPAGVHLPGPSRWPFVAPIGLVLIFFALLLPARDDGGAVIFPFNLPLLVVGLAVALVAVVGWLREAMRDWQRTDVGHGADTAEAMAWAAAHGVPHAIDAGPAPLIALPSGPAGAAGFEGGAVTLAGGALAAEPPAGVHLPGPSPWPFLAPIGLVIIFFGLILHPALVIGGLVLAAIAAAGWLREASREWRSTEQVGHAVPSTRDPLVAWPRRLVPVFAVVIVVSVAVALLPIAFGFLGGLTPPDATPTPIVVPARPEIGANNAISFDTRTLVVPAGRDFELVFNNNDPGVPHNVDIADSAARATIYLDGEIINGVASITYQVPALAEGDYYFLCKVHPNMNGTVLARPETGTPGAGGSPGPGGSPGEASPSP